MVWASALLEEIDLYKQNGCISNDNLNDYCMIQKNSEELNVKVKEISANIADSYDYVTSYYNMARNFVANLYSVNILLGGGSIGGNENE